MAVERPAAEGYGPAPAANSAPALAPYPRDRRLSDGMPAQNNGSSHDQHHVHNSHPHHHAQHHRQMLPEIDRDAFNLLREQVSYQYQCILQDREAMKQFDAHLDHFQSTVMRALEDVRHELASRAAIAPAPSSASQPGRYDHGDIDVLASQIAAVATKANEIENLKVQLELMKSKVRRLEQENQALPIARPASAGSHRDSTGHEVPQYPSSQHHHQHHHGGHGHQHLPPIQTGASTSPVHGRGHSNNYHSQTQDPPYHLQREQRPPSGEVHAPPHSAPAHRPGESGPQPPNAISGWRPAQGTTPVTSHPSTGSARHDSDGQSISWAPLNSAQTKRPYEDGMPRDHSAPASPKRPKLAPLAPLKPRNSLGEEIPSTYPPQHGPPEHFANHPRPPLHERQPPPPQLLTTPASATAPSAPNAFRFIATTPLDASEHWRDGEAGLTPTSARGRGRGRGRGVRSRGGRGDGHGRENGQEHGTPEWEQKSLGDWHAHSAPPPPPQQLSPNGYYSANRSLPPRGPGDGPQHEYPLTPIASAVSPSDHNLLTADGSSGNKKTRTKPIRNADGVLIRKDGRPDMRSVSSANNLRKVHAKKEAERAESDGRTPTSARELAPVGQGYDDDADERHSMDLADDVSRSASPRTQLDGERGEMEKEESTGRSSIDEGEERKPQVEHRWISSKYESRSEDRKDGRLAPDEERGGEAVEAGRQARDKSEELHNGERDEPAKAS